MSGKQIRGGVNSNTLLSIRDTGRFRLEPSLTIFTIPYIRYIVKGFLKINNNYFRASDYLSESH